LVKAQGFEHDIVNFLKERVVRIGAEHLLVAFGKGGEHTRFFEAVQFNPNGIRRLSKLAFQTAQVCSGVAIEEKLQQQFDAGFGGN
jgi:hypothetical protein